MYVVGDRGLIATDTIEVGEPVLVIPWNKLAFSQTALSELYNTGDMRKLSPSRSCLSAVTEISRYRHPKVCLGGSGPAAARARPLSPSWLRLAVAVVLVSAAAAGS